MYRVTKTDVRPSADVPFFSLRLPYVRELMSTLNITRTEALSPDGLTRTSVLTAPDQQTWVKMRDDVVFNTNFVAGQAEYDGLHGITSESFGEDI